MIFIGYDEKYPQQYYNCISTISSPTLPTPKLDRRGSTAFTFSRFLIPEYTNYQGWHIFADSDFLFLDNIDKLFNLIDERFAVLVVKHSDYEAQSIKMNGKTNLYYDRKNWASLILWNSQHPSNKCLTTEYILQAPSLDLLQFKWLRDDEIGELPAEWNVLIGHHNEVGAKGLHFTNGTNNDYYRYRYESAIENN